MKRKRNGHNPHHGTAASLPHPAQTESPAGHPLPVDKAPAWMLSTPQPRSRYEVGSKLLRSKVGAILRHSADSE